ncbi:MULTISPECIES: hypothetical protein [Shewanella]|nr:MULTISPECIES: hypothetical protein [Shewanella]KPZ69701.1 hypothetical protein AN944_02682 [Shewanella sp. P1-14-1]
MSEVEVFLDMLWSESGAMVLGMVGFYALCLSIVCLVCDNMKQPTAE